MRPKIRIGYGFDVHKLEKGEKFLLGGVEINHHKGPFGHSDADVLIHVICDAILGAADLRDIGFHFSDKDPQYKGIDSKILLKRVMILIEREGFGIGNIDATVCLQQPKISSYIPKMKACLSNIMNIDPCDVSVKATTTEKLGFVGKEEGISAHCVALLYKSDQ